MTARDRRISSACVEASILLQGNPEPFHSRAAAWWALEERLAAAKGDVARAQFREEMLALAGLAVRAAAEADGEGEIT